MSGSLRWFIARWLPLFTLCACCISGAFGQTSLDAVLKKLTAKSPAVRSAGVRELAQFGCDTRTFQPLVTALGDTDPGVRKQAAIALRERRSPQAVPALLALLKDPNPNIRAVVIETLQETADPRAVNALIGIWQTDKEKDLRDKAFWALILIDDMRATDTMLAALNNPAHCARAIEALGHMGDDRAYDALCKIAIDTHHPHQGDAQRALGVFGDSRVSESLYPLLTPESDMCAEVLAQNLDPRVVPYFIDRLKDQPSLASVVGLLHDERCVEPLIRLAGDTAGDRSTRFFAINALGAIRDSRAVPVLLAALKEKAGGDMSLCAAAITALESIGDVNAVPALLPFAQDEKSPYCIATVRALGTLRSPLAIEALRARAKSQDWFMRADAYFALAGIPDARAVQSVVAMLRTNTDNLTGGGWREEEFCTTLAANPCMTVEQYLEVLQSGDMSIFTALAHTPLRDPRLLEAMVTWITRNGGRWTPSPALADALALYGTQANAALLAALDKPESTNDMVITLLGILHEPRAVPALLPMLEYGVNDEAILVLGELGAKEAIPRLLEIAQSKEHISVSRRWAALEALGALKEPRAFDLLLAASQQGGMRIAAARGLGKLGDARATETLIALLKNDDDRVSDAAAWAILQLPPDPRTIDPLLEILHDVYGPDIERRIYAAKALTRFPDERILFEFCQTVRRNSPWSPDPVQRLLIHLLGERKDRRSVRTLIKCLRSGDVDRVVAVEAAWALGRIGDQRAVPALITLVNDRQPAIRSSVLTALQQLTGQDFSSDHARWVAWWTKAIAKAG